MQLRETTMSVDTRRLVRLDSGRCGEDYPADGYAAGQKRSSDRKSWLESRGNLIEIA